MTAKERFLKVDGPRLVDAAGNTVVLRGYNVGGWMNMENFLTGYPGTESQQRKALRRALGERQYELFFNTFMNSFFSEADASYIASLGLNHVRIPFNYRHFESDEKPFELKESGFELLDRAIRDCAEHGLYVILDFHALPGCQNSHWHSDNPTHWAHFWSHRHFQDRAIHLWEALAERYRGNPWVAGYNIMNEPGDASGEALKPFYDRAVTAVRDIDPDHIIFLDGNRYSTDFSAFEGSDVYPNVVYAAHDYKTPGLVFGGPYPGETRGQYVDRDELERGFLKRTKFMRDTNTPIWIGEFGVIFTGDPERDDQKYDLLRDQLEIYAEHGASWSMWGYKDIGAEGVVSAAPDSAWLTHIRPVTEKKARLGVDRWGGLDTHIRHVMEPIEQLFEEEYPDYEPFPFGKESWVSTLVRHILLAEPLVKDFEASFRNITDDDTVVALADSFALNKCVRRQRLEEVLREAASVPPPASAITSTVS